MSRATDSPHTPDFKRTSIQWAGLPAGPLLALAAYLLLPDSYDSSAQGEVVQLGQPARATAATAVWMAVWWMTEAIPVYATALLPVVLLPLMGAVSIRAAASAYGHELIFLFMGGFVLALSMERWRLHRRLALAMLRKVGTRPRALVAGFMGITAFLSMWVSNTATALVMLPIALSIIALENGSGMPDRSRDSSSAAVASRNFSLCLLLGIAYAASIGGIGTLIGTPPNLFLASYLRDHLDMEISFVRWMGIGLPLVCLFLPLTWALLTVVLYPLRDQRLSGSAELTREAADELGPMAVGERATLVVFVLTATLWITRPLLIRLRWGDAMPLAGLTDAGIAVTAALVLFVIPVDRRQRIFVMDWETAARLPWGLLVLFGGGLSLAAAIRSNGIGEFLGHQVEAFADLPELFVIVAVVTLMIFLTELTSNTATTATLIPILCGLAPGLGMDPVALAVPAAIAASCAFMLPVATPPNAVVFGSGKVGIAEMCRAGIWLNLLGIVLITMLAYGVVFSVLKSAA